MPEDLLEPDAIPTNMRLLVVIGHVAREGVPITPASLSTALGLPKATIHRLVATAEEQGFLQRDIDGRSFGPGPRLRKLAASTLSSTRIRTERLRIMRALADRVGETCNLAAPGRDGMVYVDRVETHWPLRIQLPRGTQVPFHCTASGKLYLASLRSDKLSRWLAHADLQRQTSHTITDPNRLTEELARIRESGFSQDDQEFMESMAAIAVAVRDTNGRLLSTLSIHVPIMRHSARELTAHLDELKTAARELEALLD